MSTNNRHKTSAKKIQGTAATAATEQDTSRTPLTRHRVVSSAHLVSTKSPELSEFEFGLIVATHAFQRWMMRCMSAAGAKEMTAVDVMVLHHINHRGSEKRLADVCFVLNIEDTHVVSYSVKKLLGMKLLTSTKRGKEVFIATSASGVALCERYRQVREECLLSGFSGKDEENAELGEIARLLRSLTGRYDQAARAANSF